MQPSKNVEFSHKVRHERTKGGKIMILADKIISLRKKEGWSQEELAEQCSLCGRDERHIDNLGGRGRALRRGRSGC